MYDCNCIASDHDHAKKCSRRATVAGGICLACRYWHTFPERKP